MANSYGAPEPTQAQRLGLRPDYGIDYRCVQAACEKCAAGARAGRAKHQLRTTLRLPDGGIALLDDTLTLAHQRTRLLQVMIGWWRTAADQRRRYRTFSQQRMMY